MLMSELKSLIDCSGRTVYDINAEIKKLLTSKNKYIVLRNPSKQSELLSSIKGSTSAEKVEIIGEVGDNFANDVTNLKIIVNGNVGDNSVSNVKSVKCTIFGSCGDNFGIEVVDSEFHILGNCTKNSFFNMDNLSKVTVGGLLGSGFGSGGVVVCLNLKGGNLFLDDNYLNDAKGHIYIRGNIKLASNKLLIEDITEKDEDIYLPLISEFARLFNYSLGEIKSKPFHRLSKR